MKRNTVMRAIAAGGLLLGCVLWLGSFPVQGQEEPAPSPELSYSSFVQPQRVVVLSTMVNGLVSEVRHEPQEFVRKDETIVQLDTTLMELSVNKLRSQIEMDTGRDEARINLQYSRDNLEIVQKLYDTKLTDEVRVGSIKELKEATQRKEIAELGGKKAELNIRLLQYQLSENEELLKRHSITSPIDGVIVPFTSVRSLEERNLKRIEAGETVQAGQIAAAVMKVDRRRVAWPLPVEQVNQVKLGQAATVYVQGEGESGLPGEVVFKSPTIETTGQFTIEVEFANPAAAEAETARGAYPYQIRPGMRARVELR